MRKNDLSRIDSDWQGRGLFHKRRRWAGYIWLAVLFGLGTGLYHERDQIPRLLLGGFKLIAQVLPAQQPPVR